MDRRGEARALIGDRAERLTSLNFASDRASFNRALHRADEPFPVVDRLTGEPVGLSRLDFDDLCRVHPADWPEQVPGSREWGYRRAAYRRMAARLGGPAEGEYERAFARGGAESAG